MPSGRQLTVPFSFAYDSNGAFYIGPGPTGGAPRYETIPTSVNQKGGWSYSYPTLSFQSGTWTIPNSNNGSITCHGSFNYVFQDPGGNRDNLGLSVSADVAGGNGENCSDGLGGDGEAPTGAEGPIAASTTVPQVNDGVFPPTSVVDGNGTVYSFPQGPANTYLANNVVDRNGNTVTISNSSGAITYTDTIGRTALHTSGLGGNPDTVTLAGLSLPYKTYWTTASANFTDNMLNECTGAGCGTCPTSLSQSSSVISSIVLPNGEQFTLSYDTTYGMLTKIVYPTGGYIRYVWGLNSHSDQGQSFYSSGGTTTNWNCRYDFPAITDRYVSFNGSTEALHQHFSYSTTWGASAWTTKQTTVTTYDLVRNTNFTTQYTYSPLAAEYVPNCGLCYISKQTPVEQTIQNYDTTGALLRTITKSWGNIRAISSQQTKLDNGQSSLAVYCYGANEQLRETDQYDLGTTSPSPAPCTIPAGTQAGALIRKTTTSYAAFAAHIVDLPATVITYDGSGNRVAETDIYYDQNGITNRGNPTTITKACFSLPGGSACPQGNSTTMFTYDSSGQMLTMTDPRTNQTAYSYADSYSSCGGSAPPASPSNAYLSQITYPLTNGISHIVKNCYDYTSGLLLSSTDQNNLVTSYKYVDSLDRLTEADFPDGGKTTLAYNDTPPSPTVTTSTKINSTGLTISTVAVSDGLGHVTQSQLTSDPQGTTLTDVAYDGLGRKSTVSNPYRSTSDTTYGVTTTNYDALGRMTTLIPPDGTISANNVTTSYSANCATVTDQAGKSRKSCSDGLGRLAKLFEDPTASNFETDYQYDALNNLTSVVQVGSRQRTLFYDSLSRLITATNPEPGTITYTYDNNGNLHTKADARGITISYTYDALNRLTLKSYSNGAVGNEYYYDAANHGSSVGRLTHASNDVNAAYEPTYDAMGRVTSQSYCIPSDCSYNVKVSATYDLAGDLTSLTYPSGRVVNFTYNGASRPTKATFINAAPVAYDYLSSATYAPNGAPATMAFGNGLTETSTYNKRFQPLNQQVASSVITPLYRSYSFYDLAGHNNGNVASITDNLAPGRTQNFTYDNLNRIFTAKTFATSGLDCWAQQFGYDAWGNLLTASPTQSGCPMTQLNVSVNAKNQIFNSGFSYDAAGNLLTDGTNSYVFDAENRISSINLGAATYVYDADGNRVRKQVGSDWTDYIFFGGNVVAEKKPNGDWSDYVHAGGRLLAKADNFDNRIHITGTNCSACGWQWTAYDFGLPAGLLARTIQTGDKIFLSQYQVSARGGLLLVFADGSYANWDLHDQNGNSINDDPIQGAWDNRIFSLDAYTGKQFARIAIAIDGNTPPGNWELYMQSVSYRGADSTVYPIFTQEPTVAVGPVSDTGGVTNHFFEVQHAGGIGQYPNNTSYYHVDHLGTSRLITGWEGWPLWQGTFLPFGQEWNSQITVNHYKFTGKERDSESGLDNFGARYDSSSMGRFMSPDSGLFYVGNPQSLNRYAFVMNNPLRFIDPDGNQVIDIGTYVMTQYQQVSSEIGTMDWFWAAGMAVGGRGVESGPWMKTIGRDQAENAIRILSAEHPVDNTSGAWFTESHSLWSVSVDFRVDPGAGTTASISFVSNPNGVIAAPNTSFRFNGMGEVAAGGFQFNLATLTNEQVNALNAEATAREEETHDFRYIEILRAIEQEQRRRAEEERKREEKERQKKLDKYYQ
jgi:RHS repeat-associated protein